MNAARVQLIPAGVVTTGFSERRSGGQNIVRRFVMCDTWIKNPSNPDWYRLPPLSRLAHDELERWAGRNVSRGRIRMARRFTRRDWHAIAGTERVWVDRLVAAGWARWDGEDLVLLGTDLDGETAFIERIVAKKAAGKTGAWNREKGDDGRDHGSRHRPREQNSTVSNGVKTPLSDSRSDLGSGSGSGSGDLSSLEDRRSKPPPPPTQRRAGGGGGAPNGSPEPGPEPDGFSEWIELYGSNRDETLPRWTGVDLADARRAWIELAMQPAEVRRCMQFTGKAIFNRHNTRDGGSRMFRPGKFLRETWGPKLAEIRIARKGRNHDPVTGGDVMRGYLEKLEKLGGEA